MKNVLIIYRILPQYRIEFYKGLKKELDKENISLHLIYGKGNQQDRLKKDLVELEWAKYIPNRIIRFRSFEIIYQPCLKFTRNKDLIIVEGANRLLINYYLMIARHFSRYKLAIWGHGRNLQIKYNSKRNRFKSIFVRYCDWYFAYTKSVKNYLIKKRFDPSRITVVENSIDTKTLREFYQNISPDESDKLREELNIQKNGITAIYCGAMYNDKRIDYVLEVCHILKKELPNFKVIFIGAGPDAHLIEEEANTFSWIIYPGAIFGKDRMKFFKLASFQIMPFAVGLSILDSFITETPLFCTCSPFHGPEIEYLEQGFNGMMTGEDIITFSISIIEAVKYGKLNSLVKGCNASAEKYTIEKMIENFKSGINLSLN